MSLLQVRDLSVQYPLPAPWPWQPPRLLQAVSEVSFDLQPGKTLGVVGESGCGKSTLARALLGLVPAAAGSATFLAGSSQAQDLTQVSSKDWRPLRREIQVIFQDPLASLNPRMPIGEVIAEPLRTHQKQLSTAQVRNKVVTIMDAVGLSAKMLNRYPHEFSGGQCQRIGIARALILEPKLLICDEPVSALDVSIQAQIVNLLMDVQAEFGLSLLFIAHDLAVVRHISDEVMVMYLGRAVEQGAAEELYSAPQHPYTKALIASAPEPDPAKHVEQPPLTGDVPSPLNPPSGCAFRTRCPVAIERCSAERPAVRNSDGRAVACHLAE